MAAPEILKDAAAMRAWSRQQRAAGRTVAFVPTMGYLHEGHLSLVRAARAAADVVVVSIYVNPTQFAAHEDFDVYPRDEAGDLAKLTREGVAAVFEPASLYATGSGGDGSVVVGREGGDAGSHETYVTVERLQQGLCGGSRPHFFRGVATVVSKLFNIVEPDYAMFGKKDYQQWRVIERLVRDLDFAVTVVGVDIERDADGLALSSRNALLAPEDRARAPAISAALFWARDAALAGSCTAAEELRSTVAQRISDAGGVVDYVQVVDAQTLQPVADAAAQPTMIAVAAHFGRVRLIDNVEIVPPCERGAA